MAVEACYMQYPSWGYDYQNHRLQDAAEFSLQDFRDAVDNFISDPSSLIHSELGAVDLPHCAVSDFDACLASSIHSLDGHILQMNIPPVPPPEQYWKDVADQNHKALGDALEENTQLHVTLTRKQEEIASLKERNIQLKELAGQAKHLASVLDKLMKQQAKGNSDVASEPFPLRGAGKRKRLEDVYENEQECKEVDAVLREISERCNAALQPLDNINFKCPKLHSEMELSSECVEGQEKIRMYGSFNGIQTRTVCSSLSLNDSEMDEEDMVFRTSIREHCTIRTLAFPQGNAFTTRTPGGGYKFRWVPN
ncbi:multicilin isoform X2 [Protopterus annectens]|uniref:multicilin isoform X2 n=1 Tax=Protopterus annectens TaxID=7888 RepID=UPI001CFAD76D|nr:multicilin isoform X2 [Protopterus annectens]